VRSRDCGQRRERRYTPRTRRNETIEASHASDAGGVCDGGGVAGVEKREGGGYGGNGCFGRNARRKKHFALYDRDRRYDLFCNHTYKPDKHGHSGAPDIAVNVQTKIAIEGKHAYIVDVMGREVKLHIVKQARRWEKCQVERRAYRKIEIGKRAARKPPPSEGEGWAPEKIPEKIPEKRQAA
jgi:hypothetical protein